MSYRIQYGAAWGNAATLVVVTVLAGAGLTVHPSWLTPDITATAAILVPICGGLSQILPPLQRTPGAREQNYLKANMGELPRDIAQKYPVSVSTPGVETSPRG